MAGARRSIKSDSVAAKVAAFAAVGLGPIRPPKSVNLRKGDRPIWAAVVGARARSEWSDVDLFHAANLARCLADIERLSEEIKIEGDVLKNERGTPVANPKHVLLETLSRRGVALTKLLGLQATLLVGKPAEVIKGRENEAEARAIIAGADDEGLLATPGRTVQ